MSTSIDPASAEPGSAGAPFRPWFHFTPERNWMNDPNGLVFYEGEYHLFYQYNPFGEKWGHMSWGHAVSRDLFHWEELPVALPEHDEEMIFSGSAVVDGQNTSGFGENNRPPLVAIYTARYHDEAGERQMQALAYSRDRGRNWTFHEGNPILDLGLENFRDPKVFWHYTTQSWVMVVVLAEQHKVSFYASPDLKHWSHLTDFGPAGATDGVWECPDLFPLPVENEPGVEKWVLIINLNPGGVAGGSGCQYFVGEFDGRRFVPDGSTAIPLWADFGPDFYAAVTWSDIPASDGRRLLIGWMNNWAYATAMPTSPWNGAMSLPRVLGLRRTTEGLRLIQQPAQELQGLCQAAVRRFDGGTGAEAAEWLAENKDLPPALDVSITFTEEASAADFSVSVSSGDAERIVIEYDASMETLAIDRSLSGLTKFHPKFVGKYVAPMRLRDGRCTLRLILDASSLEVFAQGGETVLTSLFFPAGTRRSLNLDTSVPGRPAIAEIAIKEMSSARREG